MWSAGWELSTWSCGSSFMIWEFFSSDWTKWAHYGKQNLRKSRRRIGKWIPFSEIRECEICLRSSRDHWQPASMISYWNQWRWTLWGFEMSPWLSPKLTYLMICGLRVEAFEALRLWHFGFRAHPLPHQWSESPKHHSIFGTDSKLSTWRIFDLIFLVLNFFFFSQHYGCMVTLW